MNKITYEENTMSNETVGSVMPALCYVIRKGHRCPFTTVIGTMAERQPEWWPLAAVCVDSDPGHVPRSMRCIVFVLA